MTDQLTFSMASVQHLPMGESFYSIVPSDPETPLKRCHDKAQDIRKDIISKQRIILTTPVCTGITRPHMFTANILSVYQILSLKPETLIDCISPQHTHYITKLYEYFVFNPSELVSVLLGARSNMPSVEFQYFCTAIIPSFFGYFSLSDQLASSYQFFCTLITKAPHDVTMQALEPFFFNASTFRYIEKLTDSLCSGMFIVSNTNAILQEIAKQFASAIFEYLPLLSPVHLNVIAFMKRSGWKDDDIIKFFVERFVFKQVYLTIKGSYYANHASRFVELTSFIQRFINYDLVAKLYTAKSQYELPCSSPHIQHLLVTPYDASIFADAARKSVELPRLIKLLEKREFMWTRILTPVWLSIYPKKATFPSIQLRSVVFGDNMECVSLPHIPAFQRRWRMFQITAEENGLDPTTLFKSHDFPGLSNSASEALFTETIEGCTFSEYLKMALKRDAYKRGEIFEEYLEQSLTVEELKKYRDIVDSYVEMIRLKYSELFIRVNMQQTQIESLYYEDLYPNITLQCVTPLLSTNYPHLFYMVRAEMLCGSYLSSNRPRHIVMLEEKWMQITKRFFPEASVNSVLRHVERPSLQKAVLRTIQQFSCVERISFIFRFTYLIHIVKDAIWLNKILKYNIIETALKACNDSTLITTVLLISSLITKKKEVCGRLKTDDITAWLCLEEVVMKFLQVDYNVWNMYMQCNDSLIAVTG